MKVVPLRQAAILLSALPKPELAAILKRLEPAHAASLAGQLTKLSRIESAELNVAIGRFLSSYQTTAPDAVPLRSPPELAAAPLERETGSRVPEPPIAAEPPPEPISVAAPAPRTERLDPEHNGPPGAHLPPHRVAAPTLGFLEELPVEQAVQLLEGEEVTLLAAVLFALSPKKAAAIAERIPVARRVQMFQVLASIEDLSDATLDHIRQRLERKLEFGNDLHARPEGLHRARQLLEQLSPGVQRGIADALAVHSPQLASELHRNVFRINDLPRLHRHDLEKVVRLIAPDVLGAALKHADNRVREFVLAVLPTAGAQEIAKHLETLEIDRQASSDAQQQIVDVVHELFRKRIITRPRTETTLRRAA